MRYGIVAFLGAFLPLITACQPGDSTTLDLPHTPRRPLPDCEWADVVDVTDGDTIRVDLHGVEERVRYIGIDTPELRAKGGPEPFAETATVANEFLLGDDPVCLERDVSDRDRYGRLLRYVWLEDGRMLNEILVAAGLAEAVEYPPDTRYESSILELAEDAARAEHRGIWR